jgi:predicted transcriptional regulator
MDRKKESIVVTVTLEQDTVNSIDKLATEMELKSSRLIGGLIWVGIDEVKALKRYGILKKGIFVLNLLEQYGLMKKKEKSHNKRLMGISLRIDKKLDRDVDKLAKELGKTKSSMIVSCINIGLEDFQALKRMGMLNMLVGLVKIEERIKELFNEEKIRELWNNRFKEAGQISKEMLNVKKL